MLAKTYERVEALSARYHGYINTRELLREGITNRQIAMLVDEEWLERVSHGHYWLERAPYEKPADYKAIEICTCNKEAVICAESACYYNGLIDFEPKSVVIATRRTNRGKITVKFPFVRHYFVDSLFELDQRKVTTDFGEYTVYNTERSICDCIRLRSKIDLNLFSLIMENYRKSKDRQTGRLLDYARLMRVEKQARDILGL